MAWVRGYPLLITNYYFRYYCRYSRSQLWMRVLQPMCGERRQPTNQPRGSAQLRAVIRGLARSQLVCCARPVAMLKGVSMLGTLALVAFSIQNGIAVLLMRYSKTHGDAYSSQVAVLMQEGVVKLPVCMFFYALECGGLLAAARSVVADLRERPTEWAQLAVPALLYTVQNTMLYVGFANVDAAVGQVTYQTKILWTAMFSVVLLQKKLNRNQWIALVVLALGVVAAQAGHQEARVAPATASPAARDPSVPPTACTGPHCAETQREIRRGDWRRPSSAHGAGAHGGGAHSGAHGGAAHGGAAHGGAGRGVAGRGAAGRGAAGRGAAGHGVAGRERDPTSSPRRPHVASRANATRAHTHSRARPRPHSASAAAKTTASDARRLRQRDPVWAAVEEAGQAEAGQARRLAESASHKGAEQSTMLGLAALVLIGLNPNPGPGPALAPVHLLLASAY